MNTVYECDCGQGASNCQYCKIASLSQEIERLNAHVAMLSEALLDELKSPTPQSGQVLHETESIWLAHHDKQVRDAALEEAAKTCLEFGALCTEVGKANIGDCFAEEIRSMKGKP